MNTEEWWPKLSGEMRAWLIAHNGEALSPDALQAIVSAGGPVISDAWWGHQAGPTGFYLPDEAVDWIEETSNSEH